MRVYLIVLLQLLLWSLYSFIEWFAKYDGVKSKGILLIVFIYLAFLMANSIGLPKKYALVTTVTTMLSFFALQKVVWGFIT
ncbi:hypothetical protein LCL95_02490 [Bacillus timonensis]|nr:hypothetical protein [Bacillus timonensis]